MNSSKLLFFGFVLFLLSIFLFGCIEQNKQNEVKIGAVLPLSGWGAYDGDPLKKGMLLAQSDINDPNFSLIIEDAQSDNKVAVAGAIKLMSIDKVDLILSQFSGISNAISPVLLDQNKILIYSGFTPAIIQQNPNAFKVYFDSYADFKALGKIALQDGKKNLAVMLVQADYAEPIVQAIEDLKNDFNFDVQYYYFNPSETDFRTFMLRAKDQNADAIISAGYEENFFNMFTKDSELGLNIPVYCGGIYDCMTDKLQSQVNGFEVVTFDMLINDWFKEKYISTYPNTSNSELEGAAMGYDMVMYSYFSLLKCPSKEVGCIKDALISESHNGAMKTQNAFNNERRFEITTKNLRYYDSNFHELN